ncbi:hypothetical protein J4464_05190 [Candidatus Woesearchaeota archaeon]|nr:hypothetical protein [Candidatus Woesearchaeota archaeon]
MLSFGHYQIHTQAQRQMLRQTTRLRHIQKRQLRQLLELRQYLVEPSFPNPVRGLEGMLVADTTLKERDAAGLLIGGLSWAVWNPKRTEGELAAHKDVDVLVLDDLPLAEKFERGVDWWLPYSEAVTVHGRYTIMENVRLRYWQNGNGVILRYGIKQGFDLPPGLYIPGPENVLGMLMNETVSMQDSERVEVDEEVASVLRGRFGHNLRKTIAPFVRDKFKPYVIARRYDEPAIVKAAVERDQIVYMTPVIECTMFSFAECTALRRHR